MVAGATGNVGAMLRFMPEGVVETTLGILGEPTEARLCPGLGVEDVPDRPPRPFTDWARRHADLFRRPRAAPRNTRVRNARPVRVG